MNSIYFVHLFLLFMHLSMHDALHKSNNHLIVELHITAMYAPNKYKNIGKKIIHFLHQRRCSAFTWSNTRYLITNQ